MPTFDNRQPPDGALAFREYEVPLAEGGIASVAFTLSQRDINTNAAQLARDSGAVAYGFVSVLDHPHAPVHPIVWMRTPARIAIAVSDDDAELAGDIKQLIAEKILVFFDEIADVAPELTSPPAARGERRRLN